MSTEDDDFSFAVDAEDPAQREDGQPGPPDDWPYPSWFDLKDRDWWWKGPKGWHRDPCPARALGMGDGEYIFVTAFGEKRHFTAGALHGRGGLADLFVGSMWWPMRHFRKFDIETRTLKGGIQRERCISALMRCCRLAGFYDGRTPMRSVGTWRGPEGYPIVHAGDRIFDSEGMVLAPGQMIGDALFVIGGRREPPAHAVERGMFEWQPAGPEIGRLVAGELDEWVWDSAEARDLFQGGLHCDMLCSALLWLPHKFVRAPYGSGKSSLLRYAHALAGAASHAVLKTYSKAYIEQSAGGTACAFYLDEMESDEASDRMRKLRELVRQLSDDGAEGGRGSTSGRARKLDVHGTVTMAATLTEEWPPQDRSRITLLELKPFRDRGRPPAPPELIADLLKRAASRSAGLRARAIALFDLFLDNLKVARGAILALGGSPRDADQLGHLIAGWQTMTSDDPFDPDDVGQFERFKPFILSLSDEESGEDAGSDLLNTIFGLVPDLWRSGERHTVGQLVALARSNDHVEAATARRNLLALGLRLDKREGEWWPAAWLMVATRHAGLDRLLAAYPDYQGPRRYQILRQLRRGPWEAKPSTHPSRFAGVQSHYTLIPPVFLPTHGEEAQ